ncbi:MAG: TIGR04086 family membrane protein [Bacilli bacterium]|nr:TIGR04086 family membrane protein [Bacilli bacterium]
MFITKYIKSLLLILLSIMFLSITIGTFNYFNIINSKALTIFEIISVIISMIIGGIYIGKNSNQKGFLEGIKVGLLTIIILFLFGYLGLEQKINLSTLFFYIIILISSILGSILGINKKSSD